MAQWHILKSDKTIACGPACLEEPLVFSCIRQVQSNLAVIVWELSNTSSCVCLIQCKSPSQMKRWEMMKAVMPIYFKFLFIPVPNTCKLLMIPTVRWKQQIWPSASELWCVTAHRLQWFRSWCNILAFNTAGVTWNNVRIYDLSSPILRIKWIIFKFCWHKPIWCRYSISACKN